MITRTLYLVTLTGSLMASLAFGCGGKVIVDGTANEGGQGGEGTSSSTSGITSNVSSGGATCSFPSPVGAFRLCGSMATSGPGGPPTCFSQLCDKAGNIYAADCTDKSCVCSVTSEDRTKQSSCSCTLAATCSNSPPCCPFAK
jgi:hypothetical protein